MVVGFEFFKCRRGCWCHDLSPKCCANCFLCRADDLSGDGFNFNVGESFIFGLQGDLNGERFLVAFELIKVEHLCLGYQDLVDAFHCLDEFGGLNFVFNHESKIARHWQQIRNVQS